MSKLFVPPANRGLFRTSLAGSVLILACVFPWACGGQDQGIAIAGPGSTTVGQLGPGLQLAPQPAPQRVHWVVGPAKVNLAGVAEMEIPADYRFADERSARLLIEQLRNPVPKNLVGLLIPPSGEWFALVELSEPGHVKDDDAAGLDSEVILSAIRQMAARQRERQGGSGAPVVESVDWTLEPTYEPTTHRVEWAIKAVSGGKAVVNYVVRYFGRTHVLDFVGVLPDKPNSDLASLKTVANGLSFLQGRRYEDFQAGDKVASSTLAQFLVNQDQQAEELAAESSVGGVEGAITSGSNFVWLAAVFLGLFLVGVFVLVYRAWSKPRQAAVTSGKHKPLQTVEQVQTPVAAQVNVHAAPAEKPAATVARDQISVPERALARNENGTGLNHRKRQKRYMYDKFYSRMIMRLSGSEYGNGGGNGDTELIYNQPAYQLSHSVTVLDLERELASKASAIIETQTDLIEVQRKFIEEQRKLIEEQRRLFYAELEQAKNQLELFGK